MLKKVCVLMPSFAQHDEGMVLVRSRKCPSVQGLGAVIEKGEFVENPILEKTLSQCGNDSLGFAGIPLPQAG